MSFNNGYYGTAYPQMNYYQPLGAVPDTLNQYKTPYQPIQTQQMQSIQQPSPPTNDMLWVQGEAGAKAYLVAPNNTVTLWDSENPTIYVKSADSSGIPSMRILDFTERIESAPKTEAEHVCKCSSKFVKIDDFNTLREQFEALQAKLETIIAKPATKTAKTAKEIVE